MKRRHPRQSPATDAAEHIGPIFEGPGDTSERSFGMQSAKRNATPEQIEQWWKNFKEKGCETARNSLMEAHLHLVKYAAERMSAKLPGEVDVDDLISAGIFGLMDAIKAYDTDRGVKFSTSCSARIRGSILDELRS